jgi:hypothetical protein
MPDQPSSQPVCRIIAGPNGSGKTTFALSYLPQVAPGSGFVNADLIAAGLSPPAPEQRLVAASRLFLRQIREHIAERRDGSNFSTWRCPTSSSRASVSRSGLLTGVTRSPMPTSSTDSRAVSITCCTTTRVPSTIPFAS